MTYAVVYERALSSNWSAYVPDLPGCVTTGDTFEETEQNIQEAIAGHIRVLKDYGETAPGGTTVVGTVEVA